MQAGENSTLLEVEAGVINDGLNSSEPERQLALDEVRDELVSAWEAQQRAEQAQQAAQCVGGFEGARSSVRFPALKVRFLPRVSKRSLQWHRASSRLLLL